MCQCSKPLFFQILNVFVTMVGAGIVSLPLVIRASGSVYIGSLTLLLALIVCCFSMHVACMLARFHLTLPRNKATSPLLNQDLESTYNVDLTTDHLTSTTKHPHPTSSATITQSPKSKHKNQIDPPKILQSYNEIVATYLPECSTVVEIVIMVLLIFVLALFLDVAHDSITATDPSLTFGNGYPLRAAICCVMCLFSFPSKLESLKYTSMFGFISLTYLLAVIFARSIQRLDHEKTWHLPQDVPEATLTGIAFGITTQFGAFSAVFNSVAAQAELPIESQMKGHGSYIPITAAMIAFIFYLIFGICGYVALDGNPPRDILTGFSTSDQLMSGARIAICFVSIFKAPLIANPLKKIIIHRLTFLPTHEMKKSVIICSVLFTIAFGIGSLIPDPGTVFGYVSAFGVNITMFIIPSLCLRSVGIKYKRGWFVLSGTAMALFGFLVMVAGLYATVEYHGGCGIRNGSAVPSGSSL